MAQEQEWERLLRQRLSPFRQAHSRNVAEQARHLALRWGADPEKAYFAGFFHDICKELPREEQLQWMGKSDIIFDELVLSQPQIWHGFAAAEYLRCELNVTDPGILNAVRYHTSARRGMALLEQTVYLADLTSAERDYPDVAVMRELADTSVEGAMLYALQYIMGDLVKRRSPVCAFTWEAYNEYALKK
ncbi:MAG: bis(5'-nucleosyl)-tetraphosphatase (symmetrical) YqeK [Oscillospiraceae bacterium]|nr:bis(5'-nucleosyl)-tetraphosphatase (symmetrical) YqeK [Oscillospiraceae bacterium]